MRVSSLGQEGLERVVVCFAFDFAKMASSASAADCNWQTTRKTLMERNKFMFNNALISDVKFVVKDSTSADRMVALPAHKYVLSISSPVFFAMFYGDIAETGDAIELPDCDSESFLEFLRFLYCDEINLTGNGVLQILYLAKKYIIPSLSVKCSDFLNDHLGAVNVFSILPGAQKFEENDLVAKCWDVIDCQTEHVIRSEGFLDVSKEVLISILGRDSLTVREVELLKAVDSWAAKECKRQGWDDSGEEKRRVLGDSTLNLIRFPLMPEREFAEHVPKTELLSESDLCAMFLYFNSVSKSTVRYSSVPREIPKLELPLRCKRFGNIISPRHAVSGWAYGGNTDDLCFSVQSVSGSVALYGVRLFGSRKSVYHVKLLLHETSGNLMQQIVAFQEGRFKTDLEKQDGYYGFDVLLAQPYVIESGRTYALSAKIVGPPSFYGMEGKDQVSMCCGSIKFTFSNVGGADANCTNAIIGQFVEFIFCP